MTYVTIAVRPVLHKVNLKTVFMLCYCTSINKECAASNRYLGVGLRLMCSKFNLLFFPALPKKFTHYSYFMLLSLPIILIKFFLAILHVGSSGVVNVAGAAVKQVL